MAVITESVKSLQPKGKRWAVTIIEGDRQGSSAFYPKEVLEAGRPLFTKGVRIYKNHPSLTEREEQPERRVEDIIGWLDEDARYNGRDLVSEVRFVEEWQPKIKELAEAGVIGLSIRAEGTFQEDGSTLAAFTRVHSVDVVTVPGAGGAFTEVLEADRSSEKPASESGAESDKEESDMTPEQLNEALAAFKGELLQEVEKLVKPVEAEAPADEEKQEAPRPSAAEVDEALRDSGLTASGRKAVFEAADRGEDYKAVLESEKAREKEIRESAEGGFNGSVSLEESGGDFTLADIFKS